jgi:hypothetical protein
MCRRAIDRRPLRGPGQELARGWLPLFEIGLGLTLNLIAVINIRPSSVNLAHRQMGCWK